MWLLLRKGLEGSYLRQMGSQPCGSSGHTALRLHPRTWHRPWNPPPTPHPGDLFLQPELLLILSLAQDLKVYGSWGLKQLCGYSQAMCLLWPLSSSAIKGDWFLSLWKFPLMTDRLSPAYFFIVWLWCMLKSCYSAELELFLLLYLGLVQDVFS